MWERLRVQSAIKCQECSPVSHVFHTCRSAKHLQTKNFHSAWMRRSLHVVVLPAPSAILVWFRYGVPPKGLLRCVTLYLASRQSFRTKTAMMDSVDTMPSSRIQRDLAVWPSRKSVWSKLLQANWSLCQEPYCIMLFQPNCFCDYSVYFSVSSIFTNMLLVIWWIGWLWQWYHCCLHGWCKPSQRLLHNMPVCKYTDQSSE